MHCSQSVGAETELRHLAAIPYQMVSPSSNAPIIGIYQDSLLGSYRFTRPNIKFSPRDAMNLLMMYPNVNTAALKDKKEMSSFDVLSQIMPPLTLKYKTKLFEDSDDFGTSNNVLEIRNGKFIRGQIEKSTLASTTKGIIHRVCNDFGNLQAADFIDNLQNVVTEYMKSSSFSVGISDLISNKRTQDAIIQAIAKQKHEVQTIIEKVHLGVFENNTANTNMAEFESNINKQLNKANEEAGKIGRKSLNKDNRFLMIVDSGSKGTLINISQMISCLGQTNVDGKRIPYGFDSRTLPHFNKFDDSPGARGFIENSYISGLTAPELFFHAMGGRIGLIDTACKSVTWETPIVFIENDVPKYMEIGKWIDAKLNIHKDMITYQTEKNMELLNVNNIYIPTVDEDGIVTWGEVTAVTRHDPGERLYEVKTQSGRSVTVAESQSLLVWDSDKSKFLPKNSPDVKIGEYMPVTIDLDAPPNMLDIPDIDIDKTVHDISNGIFNPELICVSQKIVNAIVRELIEKHQSENIYSEEKLSTFDEDLFSIPGFTYRRNPVVIKVKTIEAVNGVSLLCSRVFIPTIIDNQALTISIIYEKIVSRNNVFLDPIKEINIIGVENHPKLYDLTIPSTLNFGLANGLQVRDTSSTGYIQRRLIKGLEDLRVEYDMTVRNNMGKIVQFSYGDDGFDSIRVENQMIPLVGMSIEDVYSHYDMVGVNDQQDALLDVYSKGAQTRIRKQRTAAKAKCQTFITKMMENQGTLVKNVFAFKNENSVKVPVAFQNLIANTQGQMSLNSNSIVDITPLEAFQLIDEYYQKIQQLHYVKPTPLFETLYYFYMTPKDLLVNKRFHRAALTLLLETVVLKYKQAIVHPGEMVGVIAGQSLGEPTTQLTLNSVTFETALLVRNSKKEIQKVQIGQFTQDNIKTSTNIDYMEDKDTTYAELSEYYEVPSANEAGETVWRRIEAVTQHPVVNEDGTNTMLKITTKGNREVTATKAKSFLQLIDGKIQQVHGKDLKIGDYLPCSKKPLEYAEQSELNLREILPPTEYIYRDGCVYTKTNSICNYAIPEKIPMDYEFGYLVGAYAAEGCMTEHQVSIANNDNNYLKPIISWCERYNLTTKIDKHENKIQEQDVRIYSTVLCKLLSKLCGNLSHNTPLNILNGTPSGVPLDVSRATLPENQLKRTDIFDVRSNSNVHRCKYVSPKIVFSNKECILGFLDAYIGGDGCISRYNTAKENEEKGVIVSSVSYNLLLDVQLMMKNLGIIGKIHKPRKDRVTLPENIHQSYELVVTNRQGQHLAQLLNIKVEEKHQKCQELLKETFKWEYWKDDMKVPNIINGETIMEDRNDTMVDLQFEEIISIEEVSNTTNYAYDLTVEDTRNFDIYNGICMADTFHLSGVASKSNVTRGVPRIEEILRLTKNPKNPSLTVYLKPVDELEKDRAAQYAKMLEHTKLVDVVKSVQICFDPSDRNTTIVDDALLMQQYYEFEEMMEECLETEFDNTTQKSRWILRMEMDSEALLDKNITMDDVHFAVSNGHGNDISCIYSDYNAGNLVFRIRLNSSVFNKTKKQKGIPDTLDQSDEIYMLRNFQEALLNNIVLRGVEGIRNVLPRKLQNNVLKDEGKYVQKDVWILDTTGTNLMEVMALDFIDGYRTFSNDIKEIFDVLGIEAARQIIYNEFYDVMEFSDVYINYHHLSLLCDRMTSTKDMVSIFRSGILNDDIGPISKATFEVQTEVLLDASKFAEVDYARGVSANVMLGQPSLIGTNSFGIVLDIEKMREVDGRETDMRNKAKELEKAFGLQDPNDTCGKVKVQIDNNLTNIKREDIGKCDDDGYDIGF